MALAAAALLPVSFNVLRPMAKAFFNFSGSIGSAGIRGELIDLFASVIIKIPKKVKVMVMEQTRLHSGNVLK